MTLFDREKCCGCGGCADKCPKNAITMRADSEGFSYPEIDRSLCVECGLCRKICAFNAVKTAGAPGKVFAAKHRDRSVREKSTSGGAFTALSDAVFAAGGAVCGAGFDGELRVAHSIASSAGERDGFVGAKYVQSDTSRVFEDINAFLSSGRPLLFTGTPCQTAQMRASFGERENLWLCDLVCNGVPSPKLWEDYLRLLSARGGAVESYRFRSKLAGWHRNTEFCRYSGGRDDSSSAEVKAYNRIYFSGLATRPSCYSCPYAGMSRPGDITLGDFWGIEKADPDFDDDRGVSLLLVNTDRGAALLERASAWLELREEPAGSCLQPRLKTPCARPEGRERFWREYGAKGFGGIYKKYGSPDIIKKLLKKIFSML